MAEDYLTSYAKGLEDFDPYLFSITMVWFCVEIPMLSWLVEICEPFTLLPFIKSKYRIGLRRLEIDTTPFIKSKYHLWLWGLEINTTTISGFCNSSNTMSALCVATHRLDHSPHELNNKVTCCHRQSSKSDCFMHQQLEGPKIKNFVYRLWPTNEIFYE